MGPLFGVLSAPRSSRPAAAGSRAGKSIAAHTLSLPRRLSGCANARHSRHAPLVLIRGPRIAQREDDMKNRGARLPVTARVGPLARPRPPGTTAALIRGGTVSAAATRARAAGRAVQLCAAVLLAAILRPVIRAAGATRVGACREWPKPKPADDRRGAERVRAGDCPFARSVRTAAHSSGARPGGRQPIPSGRFKQTCSYLWASRGSWDCVWISVVFGESGEGDQN
jgi:hypothetical protein